ncbi:MAG: hypothetical protein K8I29_19300 [Alphaproteobacteria bacterium]|uniref:Uncharacterized protein n=1 Tax=Candidatus Nitrobium versatile TaxID=2884831 RepID=A0A953M3L1_9BACT|nr:hypothetical protein [Candidatus Nitrobium versatile]
MRKIGNIVNAVKRADAVPVTVFLWSIALVLTLVLSLQARRTFFALREYASVASEESISLIEVTKVALSSRDYQWIKERLAAAHPDVLFEAQADSIRVSVGSVRDYEKFRNALYSVMESVRDARWEVASLCAGEACSTPVYRAELKGYAVRITSKAGQ